MKKHMYGIDLLRIIMAFMVVITHFWECTVGGVETETDVRWFLRLVDLMRRSAVPVFMLVSCYFLGNKLFSNKKGEMCIRITRLVIQYLSWTIIYYLSHVVIVWIYGAEKASAYGFYSDPMRLLYQCLTGHSIAPQFWFHWVLIISTIFLFGLKDIFNRKFFYIVLTGISATAMMLEYSGFIFQYIGPLSYELRYPIGRLVEMLPYALLGLALYDYRIPDRIKGIKYNWLILLFVLRVGYYIDIHAQPQDFGYGGIGKVIEAVALFLFFNCFEFEQIKQLGMMERITKVAGLCMGVYAIHMLVGRLACILIGEGYISRPTWWLSIAIFHISLLFCWLINRLPSKFLHMLVN